MDLLAKLVLNFFIRFDNTFLNLTPFKHGIMQIGQGSKGVPTKTGNANTRTSGGRLVNPIGGPRAERCSLSVQKPVVEETRVRPLGKSRVVNLKDSSLLLST